MRPDRLSLEKDESSDLAVVRSRRAGTFAETDVCSEPTRKQRRFVHRPGNHSLAPGARVRVVIAMLLALLGWAGCGPGEFGPELEVESASSFVLPADEALIPVPRDVTAGEHGEWIILDNAGRLLVYRRDGTLDRQWRMPDSSVGNPEGACLLSGGRIAVADTHYHRVVVFDHVGNVLEIFGEKGHEPGNFIYPVALTVDDDGNLYVAEYGGNDRIQKFSPKFKFLAEFGSFGIGPGQFQRPSGLAWLAGKIYVVDAFNNRVHCFSDQGKNLGLLSISAGGLHYPYDMSLGSDGNLCIVEYGAGRLTVITPEGNIVGRFGGITEDSMQFQTPWGLAVQENGHIWLADTGNRRVVKIVPSSSETGGPNREKGVSGDEGAGPVSDTAGEGGQ